MGKEYAKLGRVEMTQLIAALQLASSRLSPPPRSPRAPQHSAPSLAKA